MVSQSQLCAYCADIPFSVEKLAHPNLTLPNSFHMGSVERVRRSRCPFCRLVSFLLFEDARTLSYSSWKPHDEVLLSWFCRKGERPAGFELMPASDLAIYFVAPLRTGHELEKTLYAIPNRGQTIDFPRIAGWIAQCLTKHLGDCSIAGDDLNGYSISSNFAGLSLLRFIDVRRMCIVEARTTCRYVALSYVWGYAPSLRLTTFNLTELKEPGGLQNAWEGLPRTVQDAIIFVKRIGEGYLWVDALCLLQNDAQDVDQGVNVMDLIYERALITLVAACGHDANAGLPGVHEGTRIPPKTITDIVPGVQMDVYAHLDRAMKHSIYSSRAWTFQEEILSRRTIYFVGNSVYFRCRSTTLSDFFDPGLDIRRDPPRDSYSTMLPLSLRMETLEDLNTLLRYYSRRSLTYQHDAFKAMAGIIQRLSKSMKCRFLEGLPTAAFDIFLLFRTDGFPLHRRQGFPSYSWTGWRGSIVLDSPWNDNEWLRQETWIIWYKRSRQGILSLVWDPLANEAFPQHDLNYVGYRERHPFQPKSTLSFPTTRTQPSDDITPDTTGHCYTLLQFWTLALFFKIEVADRLFGLARLIDKRGKPCGSLFLDGFEETNFLGSTGPFEVIALSETTRYHFIESEEPTIGTSLSPPVVLPPGKCYNVMLLEWIGGVAERRGIGFLYQESIKESLPPGPVWKEIILA